MEYPQVTTYKQRKQIILRKNVSKYRFSLIETNEPAWKDTSEFLHELNTKNLLERSKLYWLVIHHILKP